MSTYTWIGANGADWSVAGDWSPAGGPPSFVDIAIIQSGGTVAVSQTESISELSLATGAQLLLSAGEFDVALAIDNDGLILAGGTLVAVGAAVTLDGTGTLALSGANDSSVLSSLAAASTLVNASEAIVGTGTIALVNSQFTNAAAGVIDAASIDATGATLTVSGVGTFVNAGLLEATTATLALQSRIVNSGTIAAAGGAVQVGNAAIISGGTLASSGAGQVLIDIGATLDGSVTPVVNTGTINAAGGVLIGTLVNQGNVIGSALTLQGTVTLSGSGVVSGVTFDPNNLPTGDVLINVNNTIAGARFGFSQGLTNEATGVIASSLLFNVVNDGTIEQPTFQESTPGGVVDQLGGGTIDGAEISGDLLPSETIEGGTLNGQLFFNAAFEFQPGEAIVLDGSVAPITNLGTVGIGIGTAVLLGSIDNIGTVLLTSQFQGAHGGGQLVVASPTVSLSGGGQIQLMGSSGSGGQPYPLGAIIATTTGEVLVNADNTISGPEGIGAGGLVLDNQAAGLIEATGGSMTLDPLSLTNEGTLEADGAPLVITTGTYTDLTGTWIADASTIGLPAPDGFAGIAGEVRLDGAAAGFVSTTGTGVPSLTNSYLSPQTILAGGSLDVMNGATFGIARTPTETIVVGNSTVVTGNSLQPFGNAGMLSLAGGTADLVAAVTNTGVMFGNGSLIAAGAVANNAGGTIEANGGLLTFQGALTGGELAVDAGATLELSSGWFGGGGAIPVSFDAGSDLLQIDVTDDAGTFSNVGSVAVNSFVYGDTIVVHGSVVGGGVFPGFTSITNDGTTLGFVEGEQTLGALDFAGGTANLVIGGDANNDTIITVACFVAGTRILTVRGEVPVEELRIGEAVPTLHGRHSGTVRWLGRRSIDCYRHPRPHEVWPICVQAGAFAPEVPRRDLWLSPDHAVYVDEMLIPVRYLVNGSSIAQVETASVTYWHLELDRHDVVLAEGLAAESYLDTGNRSAFAGGGGAVVMHAAVAA